MKIYKRYKFLRKGMKSDAGNTTWEIGQWQEFTGELELCKQGFHCSRGIYQAFSYVQGEILAEVEVRGKSIRSDDKEVWSQMRITSAWKWKKKDSVAFAVFAARQVLHLFERNHPYDLRPRRAIEAAERYSKRPTTANRADAASAAWATIGAAWDAARATRNAWATRNAAWDAARATSAAWATIDATRAATWTTIDARSAAARAAAWATRAACARMYSKLDRWMASHLEELKEINEK